jgi:hypothetical protein
MTEFPHGKAEGRRTFTLDISGGLRKKPQLMPLLIV